MNFRENKTKNCFKKSAQNFYIFFVARFAIFSLLIIFFASCKTIPNKTQRGLHPLNVSEITPQIGTTESGFENYEIAFASAYKRGQNLALQILQDIRKRKIENSVANNFYFDFPKDFEIFAVAIIFPELTRYDAFRDAFEISENSRSIGTSYEKNYSVGEMQMTQTFACDIEKKIALYDSSENNFSKKYSDINFGGDVSKEAKKARLARISKRKYQISYLLAFIEIFSLMYKTEIQKWILEDNKAPENNSNFFASRTCLAFFATAYNAGFTRPIAEVAPYMMRYGFPYGGYDFRSHWNYRTISQAWFDEMR